MDSINRIVYVPVLLLLLPFCLVVLADGSADLIITRADRKIDLQSHVVRIATSFKVENGGSESVGTVVLTYLTKEEAASLAFATGALITGKSKYRSFQTLQVTARVAQDGPGAGGLLLEATLPDPLKPGASVMLECLVVLTGVLRPFPAEIGQADSQLVLYRGVAYAPSPYPVRTQTTTVRLPSARVETFSAPQPARQADVELRLGPYETTTPLFTTEPLEVHFENNRPFPVAESLTREIEVSHWGNVYVTEDYDVVHEGARLKGVFSRLEMQSRPHNSALSSLRGFVGFLPARARAVYFRDDIGNISTSNLRQDGRSPSSLELAPRYPLMGGWRTAFQLGYSVPLEDLVSISPDGTRVLNASFGTPIFELPVKSLTVKVVLPEGSWGVGVDTPDFALDSKGTETKYSYLDTVGRPVVILHKLNVVPENGRLPFQVRYKFPTLSLLAEPLLLVAAFAAFFVVCAVYVRLDLTISKSSPAYQAKLQHETLLDALQRLQAAVAGRLRCVDELDAALLRLGRTGNVASLRSARKEVEERLRGLAKDVRAVVATLEALPKPPKTLPSAQALAAKDKEYADKALQKLTVSVEAYEKELPAKDIDARTAPLVERLNTLRAEIRELLRALEE